MRRVEVMDLPIRGVSDAWRWLRRHRKDDIKGVNEREFSKVIKGVFTRMGAAFASGFQVKVPLLGWLYTDYEEGYKYVVDGKVRTSSGIDWKTTKELWAEDAEAYNERRTIWYESEKDYRFRFTWAKNLKNVGYYSFALSCEVRKDFWRHVHDGGEVRSFEKWK